ncbi:carboxypeptidase regulatory-like domain-containing protein [Deinococcus sp. KSM4-11]|uniref:carboxypeptidase regulatory-like domain-containing protein n=1 Tax=Deinococcus sp. KSM4-11 TaxID=2568654 RepID=UPI0010A40B06|nr:carboxypeptidase regulatory-like domain-containing protein [Deinococcus sp. KSM4-11]THF87825.1 carboxypeptidase regulatory-like domain-containing protein [Deinococcus sp. KSM4-11]
MNTRTRTAIAALVLTALLAACGGSQAGTNTPPPGQTGGGQPDQGTPYTMTGTVKNAAGQPIAGAEVWADNTLYYNMNALGTTDAQGRYTVALPRDQIGTWRAGGRVRTKYAGQWYDLTLVPDTEAAFATDAGAIRNFTLKISGEIAGGGTYGGKLYPYAGGDGDFDLNRVEFTLTPDGPLIDGSAGSVIRRFLDDRMVRDIPIGKYVVTARYVPPSGPSRPMVLMGRDEDVYSSKTTITFHETPDYGLFADLTVSLAP